MRTAGSVLLLAVAALAEPDPKVELGRRLFMDPTVSRSGKVSCSSCHIPEHGFSDTRAVSDDEDALSRRRFSPDSEDPLPRRHARPTVDVAAKGPLHSDGLFMSLDELLLARLGPASGADEFETAIRERRFEEAKAAGRGPDERAFHDVWRSRSMLYSRDRVGTVPPYRRLAVDDRYAEAFGRAFGAKSITTARIVEALRAYVLSVRSGPSAFDRGEGALTDAQRRGLALFTGRAGCAACHPAPTFTDGGFHDIGISQRSINLSFDGTAKVDGGAGQVTFVAEDLGKFRTPSLRDVATRTPYMHDGSFATLDDVVRHYNRGGAPHGRLDPRIAPLGLADGEVADLVAFLGALTSDRRPGLGPARVAPLDLRVVDLAGAPLAGLSVEIRPAGDRLEDGKPDDPPRHVVTDPEGRIRVEFPPWTHVRLVCTTHEIQFDWPIPDCAPPMDVIAAPRDRVALWYRTKGEPAEALTPVGAVDTALPRFLLVRRLDARTAIYATQSTQEILPAKAGGKPKRALHHPGVLSNEPAIAFWGSRPRDFGWGGSDPMAGSFELDRSGGWTDPLDDRPGDEAPGVLAPQREK